MTLRPTASRLVGVLFCALSLVALPARGDDIDEAQKLVKQGDLAQALAKVDGYLAARPKDARARFLKGVILTEQNKAQEAIKVFTALTEDHPELPEPYNNLAVLYAAQGQYDKARHALEMAIQTHPAYATAHENLGDLYAKLASLAYDRALQLDRGNTAAQTKLSLIKEIFPVNARRAQPAKAMPDKAVPTAPATQAPASSRPAFNAKPAPLPSSAAPSSGTPVVAGASATGSSPRPAAQVAATPATEGGGEAPKSSAPGDDIEKAVRAAVAQWAQAWSSQDVARYLASYAPDFEPPKGLSRAEWEKQRRERLTNPRHIQVTVRDLRIAPLGGERVKASFRQHYKTDRMEAKTSKTLVFVKVGSRWLIQQERVGGR